MSQGMDDPQIPGRHPALVDLADLADGTSVEPGVAEHVASCPSCQETVERFGTPLGDVVVDTDELAETFPSIAADGDIPPPDSDPLPGELWQLEWGGAALLVAVRAILDDGYEVIPVTGEAPEDPAGSVVVERDMSPLGLPLHLWLAAGFDVPLGVFLRPLGRLEPDVLAPVEGDVQASTWEAALLRLELLEVADELSSAEWVPRPATAPVVPLRDLLRASAVRPSDVGARTSVRAADVTAMIQGRREPTDAEARELAAVLGVEVDAVRQPVQLPEPLVRALERPVHRAAIRLRAARERVSEGLARLAVGRQALAMPARTTVGERDVETWDQLVRQVLGG